MYKVAEQMTHLYQLKTPDSNQIFMVFIKSRRLLNKGAFKWLIKYFINMQNTYF